MKIVADSHIPYIEEYFGAYGQLILCAGRSITPERVKDADMLLVRSITKVDKALLAGSRVKFVGSVTAGADHIDTKWLDEAGIAWSVASGFNAPPVADYVVSTVAALQNKQLLTQKKLRAAVIGVGNVGRLVADRLTWLGFDVVLCDPIRQQNENDFVSVPLDDLADLDLISLHVPLHKIGRHPTYHFIEAHFLQRQKPGCVLLNASRGAVINTDDLFKHGSHLVWCFDVWENEPAIHKAALEQALIATPHIAGYSVQSKMRGIDMIYRIAVSKEVIEPQPITPIIMPKQQLSFSGEQHGWQDIVLGVFNPAVLTEMMRSLLMPASEHGPLFDEMRNQFNFRYELSSTHIAGMNVPPDDRQLLMQLGLRLS